MKSNVVTLKRKPQGFTLVELLVTVAIVGILAAIAYPSYTRHITKSRRAEAKSALLDLAGREEKRFSTMNSYTSTPSELNYTVPGDTTPMTVGSGFYTVAISVPTPTSFLLTATAAGKQAGDTQCATLTLTHTGVQGSTGGGTDCW